jgi:biotin carboxyl carrier protein
MKNLRITVDGKTYDVSVEVLDGAVAPVATTSAPRLVATPLPPVARAPKAPPVATQTSGGAVNSPLAGKIISIDVKVGDTIADGDQVATVEAMKMNTFIFAEQAGQVSAILVAAGDAVEEGGTILTLA